MFRNGNASVSSRKMPKEWFFCESMPAVTHEAVAERVLLGRILLDAELRHVERVALVVIVEAQLVDPAAPRPGQVRGEAVLDVGEELVLLPEGLRLLLLLLRLRRRSRRLSPARSRCFPAPRSRPRPASFASFSSSTTSLEEVGSWRVAPNACIRRTAVARSAASDFAGCDAMECEFGARRRYARPDRAGLQPQSRARRRPAAAQYAGSLHTTAITGRSGRSGRTDAPRPGARAPDRGRERRRLN